MKLSNRAKSALATAGYSIVEGLAIPQLVAFAAQNSGIEPRNYYDPYDLQVGRRETYRDGVQAFKSEQRSISEAWRRFKEALCIAAAEGVTDTEVITEAPHAFSGRLEWKPRQHTPASAKANGGEGAWHYCTGQYFCTEYRQAAIVVLEAAIRRVRQFRPAESRAITSISELKELNKRNGGCWFEPATMRFFGTRIESGIIAKEYFITSEQPPHGLRQFSVRQFSKTGDVDTIGEFCSYNSKTSAIAALQSHLSAAQEVAA